MSAPAEVSDREIRLRLIEAAARAPNVHTKGFAAGVLEQAKEWEQYVKGEYGVKNLL